MGRYPKDLEGVIDCFRPVYDSLKIKEGKTGFPILLQWFPVLKDIEGIREWSITILKAKLAEGCKALFLPQYNYKGSKLMKCYIILDTTFFIDARVSQVQRKIVFTHEFVHFLALFYATISTTVETLNQKLKERLSRKIDELHNEQVLGMYVFLDKMSPIEDFENHPQTKDEHFRLGIEDMPLYYAEIFKNLMLSHQLFDEYFDANSKESIRSLFRARDHGSWYYAIYINIAKRISQEEWLPENFAINQANYILTKYYQYTLLE